MVYSTAAGGLMNLLVTSNAGAQEYRVKGGTQQISENLFKEISGSDNVIFDHAVVNIKQEEDKAEIFCSNGKTFVGRRVILTAPPNMIARLHFDPPLPKNQQVPFLNTLKIVFLIFISLTLLNSFKNDH